MNSDPERVYRRSLAKFPKAWQQQHSEVVVGMLLDDAEAKGMKRVPITQRVSLRLQAMAEHSTFKKIRFCAASAMILWIFGLVLGVLAGLIQAPILEATDLSPAVLASLEGARSLVSYAFPYLLTVVALTGFLYRIGWLSASFRLSTNLICGVGLFAGAIGSWLFIKSYVETFFDPVTTDGPIAGALGMVGFASLIAAPMVLLLGLAVHAAATRTGRAPVVLTMGALLVVFAAMVMTGSGLIQVLAPVIFAGAWLQEKSPLPWLGPTAKPPHASRPHVIEWTRGS